MTIARRRQICLDITPYYHCISRCVRRSYLCGKDKHTHRNFNHRRGWIEERLLLLGKVFCVEVAGYAIMSNHFHVVLKVDQEKADALSDDEVLTRWLSLYKGTELAQRYQGGETLHEAQMSLLRESVTQWRAQLSNLSRFMGNLNEHIARKANKEDACTGRFWEGRFKLQAILDLPALLQTLCYVDLNPLRAKMAKTPEKAHYTSIRRRLKTTKDGLTPLKDTPSAVNSDMKQCNIPISLKAYLELLDWTARQYRKGKRGVMGSSTPSIMTRLGYSEAQWKCTLRPELTWKQKARGNAHRLREYCEAMGQRWMWGMGNAGI